MLTVIIGFIGFVVIFTGISNGAWGTVAVAGVILLFLMLCSSTERRDVKAWNNRQNWWAYGEEPDWKKDTGLAQEEIAAERRAAYMRSLRDGTARRTDFDTPRRSDGIVKVCHTCGRMVRVQCELVWTSDGEMLRFMCPRCRHENWTKIGM